MPASQQTGIRVDDAGGNGATNHDTTTSHDKTSHADFLGNASTHLILYLSLSTAAQASSLRPSSLRKRLPKLGCAFKQQAGAIVGRYKGRDNVT